MTTWILVLTLLGSTSQSGRALHHIPGFKDKAACIASASAWMAEVHRMYEGERRSALCVEQK
jgi:hypothetical protein